MLTDNSLVLKKAIFSLAIGWTILIAFLCLVKFTDLPSFGVSVVDKYVHFTFHFVFTMFWGIYYWLKYNEIKISKNVLVLLASLFYGILIEILQETFTETRHADVYDVMANLLGALVAFGLFVIIKKQKTVNN